MSRFVVGVDGGGSSTVAWVADQHGTVLGRAEAGPSNVKAVGEAAGVRSIDSAIQSALREAAVDRLAVACLGLAGVDHPEDRLVFERWHADRRLADRLLLVNDGELVLAAGTPQGWGIAVIAGTGSIVVGKAPDGQTARAGGWGHIFGDEGSAYGTAVDALRNVARRFDGRNPGDWREDALSVAICTSVGVPDPSGLVSAIYGPGFDRARIARLATVVVEIALKDREMETAYSPARMILEIAGIDLAGKIHAVALRLDLRDAVIPLAMAGGFLLSSRMVSSMMEKSLTDRGFLLQTDRVEDPAHGAIVLALRALNA